MKITTFLSYTLVLSLFGAEGIAGVNLSPANWPQAERQRLEAIEAATWVPAASRQIESAGGGIVSATVSPIAVYAGVEALRQGGTAADAAAVTALTQVTTQLGSVVSYAGIFTMLYYDAAEEKVYSMDAGYNSYLGETDPMSIPVADLATLNYGPKPSEGGALGRQTLVPGFMAGLEAMHRRFGKLPFAELFAPAIWYDEQGVTVSPVLAGFFEMRKGALSRTPEGRAFLGAEPPKSGARFFQPELARTLKAVAKNGVAYLYTGDWARAFVQIVQREGGRVSEEDLSRYAPIWAAPRHSEIFGSEVYVNAAPHLGGSAFLLAMNLVEARGVEAMGPYWNDPETFRLLTLAANFGCEAVDVNEASVRRLKEMDAWAEPEALTGKDFARSVAPKLEKIEGGAYKIEPRHSNAIVVIDKWGNIAAITHTVNTLAWGDTGIVVGGIPIPDSAGFQQPFLASIKPGDRVPHFIVDTISFRNKRPVLATAGIGWSLIHENLRVLVGVLAQKESLAEVTGRPPLLSSLLPASLVPPGGGAPVPIPERGYDEAFVALLKENLPTVTLIPMDAVGSLRGDIAAVSIDPENDTRTAVECPDVPSFAQAE